MCERFNFQPRKNSQHLHYISAESGLRLRPLQGMRPARQLLQRLRIQVQDLRWFVQQPKVPPLGPGQDRLQSTSSACIL